MDLKVRFCGDRTWSCWHGAKLKGYTFQRRKIQVSTLDQFHPIALLNVEGKIMFGILAERLSSFVLENGLINTSVQKAGIPGSPGCLEHASIIWHTIQESKRLRENLSVVWLDLANAYGSVPHALIQFAIEFLWVPEKVRNYIMQYYSNFQMRFTTTQYTTSWQSLEVGIPMGYGLYDISHSFRTGYESQETRHFF